MTVEDLANGILAHVPQESHDPEAMSWFLSDAAAEAADELRRAALRPDGSVLLIAVHAFAWHSFCRYLASGETDPAALGRAVLCFHDVHRADPESVPAPLGPVVAILAGEPAGADTDPGDVYLTGTAVLTLYQQERNPVQLQAGGILLRHAVDAFPAGSLEQGAALSDFGLVLLYAFREGAGREFLADAVQRSRTAVAAAPGDRAEQARRHGNLGFVLRNWAEATGDPAAARESVAELRLATRTSEPEDPHYVLHLAALGAALASAAVPLVEPALLSEGVGLLRRAVAAASGSGQPSAAYLSDLGMALVSLSLAPPGRADRPLQPGERTALFEEGVDALRQASATALNPLERAVYLGHLALVLSGRNVNTADPRALDGAYTAAREAMEAAPPGHPAHTQAQYVLSQVLRSRYVERGRLDDLEAAVDCARRALEATAPDTPPHVTRTVDLADLLRLHADAVAAPEALAEALAMLRALAAATPPGSPQRAEVLLKLARALAAVGHGTGAVAEAATDEAVRVFRECLTLPGESTGYEATVRFALGAVVARHRQWTEGVSLMRQGVDLLGADDARRSEYLSDFAGVHLDRAREENDPAEYSEAVRLLRQAVASAAEGDARQEAVSRSNLGVALVGLASLAVDEELLAEGVQAHRDAVAVSAPDDHYRPHRLGNLGDALQQLAQFRSDATLVVEAVEVLREAARAGAPTVPGSAASYSRLGNALRSLTRFTGDGAPLEEAVSWHRRAVAALSRTDGNGTGGNGTGGHGTGDEALSLPGALLGLANVLGERFRLTHDETVREEALQHYRAALAAAPRVSGERHAMLSSYGHMLWSAAVDTGDEARMDTAVGTLREAVATAPARHAQLGMVLTNLGSVLMQRARITGDRVWLAEAVTVLRRAVDESPPRVFERAGLLSNLAEALRAWYGVTEDRAAAEEAVALLREASTLEHGVRHGPDLARVNLGVLLHDLALEPGPDGEPDPGTLAASWQALEEAVARLGDRDPLRPLALANLAGAAVETAEQAEEESGPAVRAALERAVSAAREALDLTPEGHRVRARTQWVLARAQWRRALLGESVDLAEATRLARRSARNEAASLSVRVLAARTWGDVAATAGRDAEARTGYAYAVGLLPRLAPHTLGRADRAARLGAGLGLACDAAAMALRVGDPESALTLLEQGRGVLLAQGLEMRGDLSRLRAASAALAAEFERIREALSTDPAPAAVIRTDLGSPAAPATEQDAGLLAESRYALARSWEELLVRIRELPGLEDFLRPPRVADLIAAASAGPVVVVNVSRYRSDALVVTAGGGVEVVPLPALTPDAVLEHAVTFATGVDAAYGDLGAEEAVSAMRMLSDTLEWLWDSVAGPVLDRLGLRTVPIDGEPWTRLWWCPTGWLSFLPLHAAGRREGRSAENVMDRAISSYTPTLGALVRARQASGTAPGPQSSPAPLVVALAETPGAAPLPGASREARLLRELFPAGVELAGAAATVDAVRRALPDHPWVHFSCHGVSDPMSLFESGLILHDGRLTALDVAAQHPGAAVLAVLSACSTSQGGFLLPDEAVHLSASFQLAGYPHVVGTLWPVSDKLATRLAEEFYTALADDIAHGRPIDPAAALHRPVRALRGRLARAPHLWAAHIHAGP
ncbi:CHAT domain-containing protein [Streptomyces sp. NPDC090741]|uniref:CHAT domain-containing tetratricopeptide repeat protein n=1 Tax=Streptomyces sp. NPDC090741 TaxID=3365967 RepID=UPI0038039AD8